MYLNALSEVLILWSCIVFGKCGRNMCSKPEAGHSQTFKTICNLVSRRKCHYSVCVLLMLLCFIQGHIHCLSLLGVLQVCTQGSWSSETVFAQTAAHTLYFVVLKCTLLVCGKIKKMYSSNLTQDLLLGCSDLNTWQ